MFRKYLEKARVPTPSSVLADLLLIRIAKIEYAGSDKLQWDKVWFLLETSGGRTIEINGPLNRTPCELSVGMPGPPAYQSVSMSQDDQRRVVDEFRKLYHRSQARRDLDNESNSEMSAINIIEAML